MAIPAAILTGTAISAYGSIREGQAVDAASQYNAQVAENNALQAIDQATEEERRHRILARKQLGAMRAGYGASGIEVDGSALDVLEDSAATAERDALTIRYGGQVRAQGFRNEARLERFRGSNARTQSYLTAASTVLFGAAKAGDASSGAGKKGGKGATD